MRLYIAGPMRGIPFYNFPLFDECRDFLIRAGHTPISPADLDRAYGYDPSLLPTTHDWNVPPLGMSIGSTLRRDIDALDSCGGIVMLDRWWLSRGAFWEHHFAVTTGKKTFLYLNRELQPL